MPIAQHWFLVAAIDARIHTGGPNRAFIKERNIHSVSRRMMRIAHRIMTRNEIAVQRVGIVVVINAAIIVLSDSPLTSEASVVQFPFAIHKAQAFGGFRIVKPVVEAKHKTVVGMFHRALTAVVFEYSGFFVSFEIAIGVFTKPKHRRLRHEHAAFHQRNGTRHLQAGEKIRALVHAPVAVGILQHAHAARAGVLALAVHVGHEGAHLHHPHPPIGIEGHGHGVVDQRIGGGNFNAKPRREFKTLERLRGRECGRGRNLHRTPHFGLSLPFAVSPLGGSVKTRRQQRGNSDCKNPVHIPKGAHPTQHGTY